LKEWWQFVLLGAAAVALLIARRGVVQTLVVTGVIGAAIALAGGALP
jgi:chromate transporter